MFNSLKPCSVIGQLYEKMALFGIFGTKTKADWDREIARINSELASQKSSLATLKSEQTKFKGNKHMNFDTAIGSTKSYIERLKGELANAKLARKNAPK